MMLLDCTFRDGGYYTNWNFDDDLVKSHLETLNNSGMDIIEMGYKSPVPGGEYRRCNDGFIKRNLPKDINSRLAFMIDVKDFIVNNKIDKGLLEDVIKPAKNSPFSVCRAALKFPHLNYTNEIIDFLKELGYDVIINIMQVTEMTSGQLNAVVEYFTGNKKVEALYFADSLGSCTPNEIKEYTKEFKKTGIAVGVHCHDNMGLAFANTLAGLEEGATYADSTMMGMGRGVGNTKTEQILMYLQNKSSKYHYVEIDELIQKYYRPLHKKHKWGWTTNYMYTGIESIHPTNCQVLQAEGIPSPKIKSILGRLSNKTVYDAPSLEKEMKPKCVVIIPARYQSSRLPGKPLVDILGKPMVIRVADIAAEVLDHDDVYIATDSTDIATVVRKYNYHVVLTSNECLTGTDRVAEAAEEIDADIYINIQGDEPLLDPDHILKVIEAKRKNPNHVICCIGPMLGFQNGENVNIPKLVTNLENELIYASRSSIPSTKSGKSRDQRKQVCVYAFSKNELEIFHERGKKSKTPLEWNEDIELLRFVEMGVPVKMVDVDGDSHAVDIPEDVAIVENMLRERGCTDEVL